MSQIFISYGKQDIEFARYFKLLLEQQGFRVWIDERGIDPSDDWWETIERNIISAVAVAVIMSPGARDSKWIKRELLLAEDENKPLFPVLLSGKVWARLADIQYVDMTAGLRAMLPAPFIERLRGVITPSARRLQLELIQGDIRHIEADVAALKYARDFRGADKVVAEALMSAAVSAEAMMPATGDYGLIDATGSGMDVEQVLFVGMPRLHDIQYQEIRALCTNTLSILATTTPTMQHLAVTIHGPGFGLDEIESLLSQVGGYVDALKVNALPAALEKITIVERDDSRLIRLREALQDAIEAGISYIQTDNQHFLLSIPAPEGEDATPEIEEADDNAIKPHAFVAITRNADTDDLYYYGIQTAVHANGLLCESTDEPALTPENLAQIKKRIDTATVVIVELSDQNPAVYLQMGYAWGKKRPTILLSKDKVSLAFDSEGQLCIIYQRIKQLEETLSETLREIANKKK